MDGGKGWRKERREGREGEREGGKEGTYNRFIILFICCLEGTPAAADDVLFTGSIHAVTDR